MCKMNTGGKSNVTSAHTHTHTHGWFGVLRKAFFVAALGFSLSEVEYFALNKPE